MRSAINYCVLIFCLELVASFPYPEEYIEAYKSTHPIQDGGILRQTQNGPLNPSYQELNNRDVNSILQHGLYQNQYQTRPLFQQNVPGNAQYSHLNIINHELNEQQKQNYQNLIRNQQQIKEQQAVLQLANQLRVQNLQQIQPHYVSREPLLNTVSDSFVNNPYQPNIGNVNNISPVVPQYYQQLPSQRYFSENTAQSSAIQTEVNHDVRSPPLNRPILHNYNQWPKKQEVSVPGYDVHQLFANNPHIKNLLSTTAQRKRYMVIHPNGTVEQVDSLEPVAQKHPNYVLVNAGSIPQNYETFNDARNHPQSQLPAASSTAVNSQYKAYPNEPFISTNNLVPSSISPQSSVTQVTSGNSPPQSNAVSESLPVSSPVASVEPVTAATPLTPVKHDTVASTTPETSTVRVPVTPVPTLTSEPKKSESAAQVVHSQTAPSTKPIPTSPLSNPPKAASPPTHPTPLATRDPASLKHARPTSPTATTISSSIPPKLVIPTNSSVTPKSVLLHNTISEKTNSSSTPPTPATPSSSSSLVKPSSPITAATPVPVGPPKPTNSSASTTPSRHNVPTAPNKLPGSTTPAALTTPSTTSTPVTPTPHPATLTTNAKPENLANLTSSVKQPPSSSANKTTSVKSASTIISTIPGKTAHTATPPKPVASTTPITQTKQNNTSSRIPAKPDTSKTHKKPEKPEKPVGSKTSSNPTKPATADTPQAETVNTPTSQASNSSSTIDSQASSSKEPTVKNLNPLDIDLTKIKPSGKPVLWFKTSDIDVWSKLLTDDEYNVLYFLQIPPQPKIEKDTKTIVFSNGTVIEEITETVWNHEESDEPKVSKTIKVLTP